MSHSLPTRPPADLLATIEREALGVGREDDLLGSQAPAAWLQYLRGGSSSQLKRVAVHNHQDVVTLAALMAELVGLHSADAEHARSRDRKSTRLNSSHYCATRMPSSA